MLISQQTDEIKSKKDQGVSEIVDQNEFSSNYASINSILKEALPFELIAVLGGILSGFLFSNFESKFSEIPGLLVLVPGIMGLRGSISSSLGSRLSSSIHLGLITQIDWTNEELIGNIISSMTLNVIVSFFLGLFNHIGLLLFHLNSVGCLYLILISIISGFFSGIILSIISVFLAFGSFNIGLDPDNILTSAIATIGDILSIITIFICAKVIFG